MKKFLLRIQTYLRKLAGIPVSEEMPLPQSDIEKSLYEICKNNPNGILPGSGPSGSVNSVNGQTGNVVLNAEDVGASPIESIIEVSGATPSITPAVNTIYKCGTLESLAITNPPASGGYSIVFTSGATATTTTIPATILGLKDFAAEANTVYEINVLDNRAVVGSWAVSTWQK